MDKLEIIETVVAENNLIKNEATKIVNIFFGEISEALADGDRVEIRGLNCHYHMAKERVDIV